MKVFATGACSSFQPWNRSMPLSCLRAATALSELSSRGGEEDGVRYQKQNGPKGASHSWCLTPFSGERFTPRFGCDNALGGCQGTSVLVSGTALAAGCWQCFHPRLAPCGSLFLVTGQPPSRSVSHSSTVPVPHVICIEGRAGNNRSPSHFAARSYRH